MAEIGEIIRSVVSYSHPNGGTMQNVFMHQVSGEAGDDSDIFTALTNEIELDWLDTWNNFASVVVEAFLIEVDVINPDGTVDRNLGLKNISVSGGQAGQVTASGVAAYTQAFTDKPKTRGRKFWPGLDELIISDGALDPLVVADLLVLAAKVVLEIEFGVQGQLISGVLARVLQEFEPFNGNVVTTDIPAYQRRRKEGVGS